MKELHFEQLEEKGIACTTFYKKGNTDQPAGVILTLKAGKDGFPIDTIIRHSAISKLSEHFQFSETQSDRLYEMINGTLQKSVINIILENY